ncbi:MAG: PAS domain S-box protein [Chloroherpetonaceae bacterium]
MDRFFDDARLGICIVSLDNQLVSWNRTLQKMLGYTKQELYKFTAEDLTHPDDYTLEKNAYRKHVLNQKSNSYRIEKRLKRKDGTYFWTSVTASVIRDPDGIIKYGIGIIEDITERKETEARLLESEERFRLVSEMISDYAYSYRVHEDGSIEREWITDAATRMTGYSLQELLHANTWLTAVHPDDIALSNQKLKEVLEGHGVEYELRIITKDGHLRWIRDYAIPIWDAERKRVVQLYGAVADITAQKTAQEVLAKSEARFRQLFELAPIGVAIVEYGGKFLEVNPALCQFLGYSREELLTMSASDVSDPDDMKANILAYQDLTAGKTDYIVLNKHYTTKDGRRVVGELHLRAIATPVGEKQRFIGQLIDITDYHKAKTELEERERRFRLLIQNASDITAIADAQGRLTYVSPSAEPLLGNTPESLIGKSIFNRIHPDDAEKARSAFHTILNEVHSLRIECRYQHKNGTWKFFEANLTRQLDEPTIQGIVFNVRDITERKQIEQQLLQAQKMEAIGTLAGGIAHDFNNIMASILVATQLVKEKPDHVRTRERMEMIERAVKRGKGVVDQLLYFARDKKPETKRVDCSVVIAQVIEMLEHSFPKEIQIVNQIREQTMVLGDADQLYQVFLNIAINARDAMPHGGTLTFESEICYDDITNLPLVAIHITDTGIGMSDEVKARMFEPFFTTKEVGKGTGLGLAVVHSVVKSHKGRIDVRSKVGEGTRFSLYFPRIE